MEYLSPQLHIVSITFVPIFSTYGRLTFGKDDQQIQYHQSLAVSHYIERNFINPSNHLNDRKSILNLLGSV